MVQVHVPQGIGGSIPPPGTSPDPRRKTSFLALARASFAVTLVALVLVAVIWALFRKLEL
jgi:hypothetical protein